MTPRPAFRAMAQVKTQEQFENQLRHSGFKLPFDGDVTTGPTAPLAQPFRLSDGFVIGNRFCAQPMEGWDGTADGRPSTLTFRRWRNFGASGAKLIWGGEAVAVRHDGRANPNQLMINQDNVEYLKELRQTLAASHLEQFGKVNDLLIGLQLTHSGRFCRPNPGGRLEPIIAYRHPYLDTKFGIQSDEVIISDKELVRLVEDFILAAELARNAGFDFVDVKHCHGYLGHELLSAYHRPGDFGGSFENRTRFLRMIVNGIQERVPDLRIGVRLSAFDSFPFEPEPDTRIGRPSLVGEYPYAFGANHANASQYDLTETKQFLDLLLQMKVEMVNITAGIPYCNAHIQRPALFPPSDGYLPPEDPLIGVARQVEVTTELKSYRPELLMVGSAYSYLQEWLPHVAQHNVRTGKVDFVGLGRMLLSYPEFPADVLTGKPLQRKRLCRTFSDCTTGPRQGLVSGCYPLDPYYKALPQPQK